MVTWVLPLASRSAWTGLVSRLQPASGTIQAPTQKAAMIGRARVFMIRLLSGKKKGGGGLVFDSRTPPLQGGAAKGCFAPVLRSRLREPFPVLPAHRPPACGGGELQVLCQAFHIPGFKSVGLHASLPSGPSCPSKPHPRSLST